MAKSKDKPENPDDIFISLDNPSSNKRLSVERIYQRKTQLEHILLRPDTYVGSVEETSELMYVYDDEKNAIVKKMVSIVPGLYKIFDEILVNAADNKQRDRRMNAMKVVIDPESNSISVWNNGRGIPVVMHAVEKMYVPELIFGTLLTSSNYNDDQRKVTGGRNGYGAKLCNIFSSEFTVETSCSESKKSFKMTWSSNMGKSGKTIIKESKGDFTKVTFKPDLSKFHMTHLTSDMVAVMTRRIYDLAGCIRGVTLYLNGNRIPIKTFKDYVDLYVKGVVDDEGEEFPRKVIHEVVNERWEVAMTASPGGFQQASFVNSIATTKGGNHVTYVVDQVVAKLLDSAKKKNKGGMDLKPVHIKNQLWVFVNCLIENPTFDTQTKENMTLKAKNFGSTCSLSEKFIKSAMTCGVIERVLNWARAKSHAQISKKQSGTKAGKIRGIPKLDDANEAGGKNSLDCTLIITEGDSAKTLAVSGLGVIGRDNYGVFPLRGKLLNVREATHNQIMANEEIKNMVKILGLQYNKKYDGRADLQSLRYGHLMIMTDQDQDGSHIKGLVINFIHHNWPKLIRLNFVEEFITPIVKATKGQKEVAFFSMPEFERWKACTDNSHTWRTKYYKGLGTSTAKEAKEYFSDMDKHRIPFTYGGPDDDDAILLAFSKKLADRRKEWLTSWLADRKQHRQEGVNESFLYGEDTHSITYSNFINKELILFSNADNERSIGSMVDGLKPGQRKVLFTCFKRNDKKEVKVAQLAGSVSELSAYHHGEVSLMSTIINLAHNFVGSNNLNLLLPIGQFGTRLQGGKDAASPRYIFTKLSSLARLIYPPTDDTQLSFMSDDNRRIEPEWYCPIIPMILVNGCEGIGTGYSTFVPNYDVREIVANLKRLMNGLELVEMMPHYKNFTGTIIHTEPTKYVVHGNMARLSDNSVEVTELPIRSWTQSYKENVLEIMLHGNEKIQPSITHYKEYHTDTTVRFVISMPAEKMQALSSDELFKKFKLEGSICISNMVLFDKDGCLKRYTSATDILREFYDLRLHMYQRRKDYLLGMLTAEASKLTNQARFILEKIEGKIVVENKKKKDIISSLRAAGYRSDPIKAWKATLDNNSAEEGLDLEEGNEEEETEEGSNDYNYLLSMTMWSLTSEKKEALLKDRDVKVDELRILKEKTWKDLWNEDLDRFMEELACVETNEKLDERAGAKITIKKSSKGKGYGKGRQTKLAGSSGTNNLKDTKPSECAEAVVPTMPEFNAKSKKAGEKRLRKLPKGQTTLKLTEATERSLEEGGEGEEGAMDVESSVPKAKKLLSEAIEIFSDDSGEADGAGENEGIRDDGDSGDENVMEVDKPLPSKDPKPLPSKDPIVKAKPTKPERNLKKASRKQATLKFSAKSKQPVDSSSSEEDGAYVPLSKRIALELKPVRAKKAPAAKKAKIYIDDSEESDWGASQVSPTKASPTKASPIKASPTKKQNGAGVNAKSRKRPLALDDCVEDEEKRPVEHKTTKPAPKRKLRVSSDDSDGSDWSGGGPSEDSPPIRKTASRPLRQQKKAIYLEVNDSDEDGDED